MAKNLWTREEFIVVLNLYYKLPFGRLNHTTPEVKELANLIGRSENSVALRLVNFAACDPYILATGRHGMASGAKQCQPYWDEFCNNKEDLLFESEKIIARLKNQNVEEVYKGDIQTDIDSYVGLTKEQVVKARVNQHIFRGVILDNYNHKCALTGIDIPQLLIASHILPWAKNVEHRLDPENGICLSTLYDSCFDKGLIGFDQDYKVVLSKRLKDEYQKDYYAVYFGPMQGRQLILPEEHKPNKLFLEQHMDEIFQR